MSSRIGVCLVTLIGVQIGCWLEKSGPEGHRLLVRNPRIFDVEIEMELLWAAVRPVRRDVVRRVLHSNPPLISRVNDAMPTRLLEDAPSEDPGQNALSACMSAASNTMT
jgi:hypothetical protein